MTDETDRPSTSRRRLAGIMHLDVVGFSAMMGRDEEATTDRILALHRAVRDAVEAHGGSVAGTAGDSVLASFDSIVGAVTCAERIQRALASADEADPPIRARVGIHLGDVIVDGDTVFGDGVNIAARLEQAAEPGGILVSEAVYQQVKVRVDLPFEDAGVRRLRNITDPMRLYRVPASALGSGEASAAEVTDGTGTAGAVVVPDGVPEVTAALGEIIREATGLARERIDEHRAAAGPRGAPTRSRQVPPDRAELSERIDRAVRRGVERRHAGRGARGRSSPVVAAVGSVVMLTLGVLLLVGWRTGFSESGWFPFLGAVFVALWLGRVLAAVGAPSWLPSLVLAAAAAVGALGFGGPLARAVAWVWAASILGRAIQRAARRA